MLRAIPAILVLALLCFEAVAATPSSRYFHHGDGKLNLATNKSGMRFRGSYRNPDGTYDEAALKKINRLFLAHYGKPASEISPRLIEFIDFIQDRFAPGALVTITSGYRSPSYNTGLRKQGRLAAKASLHQYGMAADLNIKGVSSAKIWEFVKELGFGGAGYYHGRNIHLDVGPARFWDETSSGVGTDISDNNKLVGIVTDRDIYRPGETVDMRFIRMTVFPIGVGRRFELERDKGEGEWKSAKRFEPTPPSSVEKKCPQYSSIEGMTGFGWRLPDKLKPGRYRVRAPFCGEIYEGMPKEVATPAFQVVPR